MDKIINYIKILSNNSKVQELLIETIGKILLKQNNIEQYIKENEDKITHIRDWIFSVVENNEQWKAPRVLTIDALNNTADKYFEKKNNKLKIIELDETHEKLIADLNNYYIIQMLTPQALDNESKVMRHCIGHGWYDQNLNKEDYKYLSLRDKYNKAHVTLEIYNNKIIQLQGKQNKIPETKYLEKLLPWLQQNKYKNIPWEDIGKYYENGKWLNFKEIKLKENVDCIVDKYENINILQYLNEKANLYFKLLTKYKTNYIIVNENKVIMKYKFKKSLINMLKGFDDSKKQLFTKLFNENYKNIPCSQNNYILDIVKNEFYPIKYAPENIVTKNFIIEKSNIIKLPDNLTCETNLYLEKCQNLKELPKNLVVKGSLFVVNCKKLTKLSIGLIAEELNLIGTNIRELPDDIKINGNLILNWSKIEKLPDNLIVYGDLNLHGCKNLIKLPDNLTVNGNLSLNSSKKIKELSNNLIVKGMITLEECHSLKMLPDNLKCETIYIDEEKIHLIKNTMDFKTIGIVLKEPIDSLTEPFCYRVKYTKEYFFKKYNQIVKCIF